MTARQSLTLTRRDLIRCVAGGAGAAWFGRMPRAHAAAAHVHQAAAPAADRLTQMRTQLASVPIESQTLAERLTMLSGPGGNVAVLDGPDGKIVVDSFVQSVWPALQRTLSGLGPAPVKVLIDTHWHVDHADNNANFRSAGATVLAHENTLRRLSESHDLLGMRLEPAPPEGRPSDTFSSSRRLEANGETIELGYIRPSHTDTDIYIKFVTRNVLHLGDVFFNGMYPFIDRSTGGNLSGMVDAASRALDLCDGGTKVIPGHGPAGDRAALAQFRDMLVTVRDRVQKLKTAGRTEDEAVVAKPTADLDETWGKGFLKPDDFVRIAYGSL